MLVLFSVLALAAAPVAAGGLDQAVSEAAAAGLAGEVLVADRERVLYARALSVPGRAHKRGDLWRWASVTKQLTATLTLQEVEAGRLSLDDTVAMRLPGFSGATAGRITVRSLLQHTSGLPNPDDTASASPDDLPSFYGRRARGVGGDQDALGFCASAVKAQPGAGFSYNNCDYIVLGAILARAEGRPFRELLRARIAAPAGMKAVDVAVDWPPPAGLTPGFDEKGRPEPAFNLAAFGPAGAAYGTSDDLVRFDQALMAGRLLSSASTRLAWTGDPKLGYVGLGAWAFSAPLPGCSGAVRLVERRGEIGGVEVRNLIAPDVGRALVVFADRSGLDFGEVWRGKGLTYKLAGQAFCATTSIP